MAKRAFWRYPRIRARFTRKAAIRRSPSFRDRFRKFGGLISFLGLVIVVVTFVVKDVLRDNQKDTVDSFEATRNVWFISENIDDLQKSLEGILYKLQKLEILNMGATDSLDKTTKMIANAENDLALTDERLQSLTATYELLYEKLPVSIRVKADMYVKPCQTTLAELQRQESVLREQPKPQSATEVSQLESTTSQLSDRYWKESKPFADATGKVLDLFQAEYLSATRHLRTFTYLSYVLYPLGIIIGILGQLAGVRPPGGE